jgi:acyl-coenzyme A synthetase/AMP-(fatty) acid ligase
MNFKVNGAVTSISCPPAPDDIAIIMYTSGSTGKPKVTDKEEISRYRHRYWYLAVTKLLARCDGS